MPNKIPNILDLVKPDNVDLEVLIENKSGNRERCHLTVRYFNVADDKYAFDLVGDGDFISDMLNTNDALNVIKIFVHQLTENSQQLLLERLECDMAQLADALYELIPADPHAEIPPMTPILAALHQARTRSLGEWVDAAYGSKKKKARKRMLYLFALWLFGVAVGWAASLMI